MARHPRDLTQSDIFHVVQRGADHQDIFDSDRTRLVYETMLAEAFERHRVDTLAYAWMSNHTHLLVRAGEDGSLPQAMHHLGSRYALWFNQTTGRDGPLFTSRFHSTPVTSDGQLVQTARYIHRNPLAFTPLRALVAYRWSSLGPLCRRREAPPWLSTELACSATTAQAYLHHVLAPQPADRHPFGALPPLSPTTLDDILRAVSDTTGVSDDDLATHELRHAELRSLTIMLAVEMRAADAGVIADRFGFSDRRSVRRAARRGRARLEASESFGALRTRVVAALDRGPTGVDEAA